MTNMSIQPLWLTYFIEILLVLEFQLTKTYFGTFSYKAHFRPQISSNGMISRGIGREIIQTLKPIVLKKMSMGEPIKLSTTHFIFSA